jgi:mono/diheme cytochrome c family protein
LSIFSAQDIFGESFQMISAKKLGWKILKITGIVLLTIIGVLLLTVELRQNRKFDAPYPHIAATTDSVVIARGKQLVFGAAHCANCHASPEMDEAINAGLELPLSGGRVFKIPIGELYAPNLTPDSTGIANKTDGEIARALRFGVRADQTALIDFMPFHNASDDDLKAIISYLRQQKPVRHEVPKNSMNILGKALKSFVIKPVGPTAQPPLSVKPDSSVAYGRYIANSVANCRGCHTNRDMMTGAFIGPDFAGGFKMETATDSGKFYITSPNLTPHKTGRISSWTEEQFIARFRMKKLIPQSHMPWGPFSGMSNLELKAIYRYLQTVKPVENTVPYGAVREKS